MITRSFELELPSQELGTHDPALRKIVDQLCDCFDTDFSIVDGCHYELLYQGADGPGELPAWLEELVRVVAERGRPEILWESGPVVLMAIPLPGPAAKMWIGLAAFLVREPRDGEDPCDAGELLERAPDEVADWVGRRRVWSSFALEQLAGAVAAKLESDRKAVRLQHEVEDLSRHLASTFEEITLVHNLTRNLRLSANNAELGQLALEWLMEAIPVGGLAILYSASRDPDHLVDPDRRDPLLVTAGECPVDMATFERLLNVVQPTPGSNPVVLNPRPSASDAWRLPGIRSLIMVSLTEGDNVFGWLAGFNHMHGEELGTVEANLLGSVATLLGIHAGNIELYRQQEEFLTGIVRALTSAIDAKDPYTCGHSDRVARIALCLAREMGLEGEQLKTIYMAGLLHDVGKIGIDDTILRKPGRLTAAEYEHIKLHPELGHKILKDLRRLANVVPTVLHHHEQWDGCGYPHQLKEEQIPLLARITAVADAYDAMASDRPYRRGLPEDKVYEIFRSGAGTQWDARVVETLERVRGQVQAIGRAPHEHVQLDLPEWASPAPAAPVAEFPA